jgi:hypothetical protein
MCYLKKNNLIGLDIMVANTVPWGNDRRQNYCKKDNLRFIGMRCVLPNVPTERQTYLTYFSTNQMSLTEHKAIIDLIFLAVHNFVKNRCRTINEKIWKAMHSIRTLEVQSWKRKSVRRSKPSAKKHQVSYITVSSN